MILSTPQKKLKVIQKRLDNKLIYGNIELIQLP
jgi:hypothetical protein